MVAGLARAAATPPRAPAPHVPCAPAAPQPMVGVVATPAQEPGQELAGGGDNMEGVEREGLFASRHAPALGEPTLTAQGAPGGKGEERKKKEKGKGKAVQTATPSAEGRAGHQQRRQAAVNAAMAANAAPAAALRSILKRPETVEAERQQAKKKVAEEKEEEAGKEAGRAAELERRRAAKVEAKRRWEMGNFEDEEGVAYGGALRPISSLVDESQDQEEMAAGKRIVHMAGMRAVEEHWEEEWDRRHAAPPPPRRQQQEGQQQRGPPRTPRAPQQPQRQQQQQQAPQLRQQLDSWGQRAAAVAARTQTTEEGFNRVGRGGKAEKKKMGLEPIKGSIPWDERTIAFERAVGAHQINQAVAAAAAAQVNIALSKLAPAHVRTEAFKISPQGRLTTAARAGASAAMLLAFKKEILEAARQADRSIITVAANSTWAELKIFVPYAQYRHENGLADLRERIEAENEGVEIPPYSMRWMRNKAQIEQHYQVGTLPQEAALVVFKVCSKAAGNKMGVEMWVAGVRFRALPFIADRADTLCARCSRWGHSKFRCHQRGAPVYTVCSGLHRTEALKCKVSTCGKAGGIYSHTELMCPNCGGRHPAQDARCRAKQAAIGIARERRLGGPRWEGSQAPQCQTARPERPGPAAPPRNGGSPPPMNWTPGNEAAAATPEWKEDPMEITSSGMESSGIAPPVAA